jgi:serine kinase of HPr protein (carbohydrate metabolism regulator)
MSELDGATLHASAVRVGELAVLIRGPSGSGKSGLAFNLITAGRAQIIPPATLIGDDRVRLGKTGGQLTVHAVMELAGLIEIRGLGIRRCEFIPYAPVGLVVDLAAADAERLPVPESLKTIVSGYDLTRIPIPAGFDPLALVVAALTTQPAFGP